MTPKLSLRIEESQQGDKKASGTIRTEENGLQFESEQSGVLAEGHSTYVTEHGPASKHYSIPASTDSADVS